MCCDSSRWFKLNFVFLMTMGELCELNWLPASLLIVIFLLEAFRCFIISFVNYSMRVRIFSSCSCIVGDVGTSPFSRGDGGTSASYNGGGGALVASTFLGPTPLLMVAPATTTTTFLARGGIETELVELDSVELSEKYESMVFGQNRRLRVGQWLDEI